MSGPQHDACELAEALADNDVPAIRRMLADAPHLAWSEQEHEPPALMLARSVGAIEALVEAGPIRAA